MRADDIVKVYQDDAEEWRWDRVAANGEVLDASSEGYVDKGYCIKIAKELNSDLPDTQFRVEGDVTEVGPPPTDTDTDHIVEDFRP